MKEGCARGYVVWNVGREREKERSQTMANTFSSVDRAIYILYVHLNNGKPSGT